MESVEEVRDIAAIREEYIVSHILDGDDSDTIGWVEATVTSFDWEDDELVMSVELPWGEEHTYYHDKDEIFDSMIEEMCDEFDINVSEFESLCGKTVWTKVRYLETEDGNIDSGTRISYTKSRHGPKYRILWYLQTIGAWTLLAVLVVMVVYFL